MVAQLTLIRGLPGSGKSTLARMLAQNDAQHVEADQFMVDETGRYAFNPARLHDVHRRCFERTAEILAQGGHAIVSNTFIELWEFADYRQLALHVGAFFQIIECRANFENVHNVPNYALASMAKRWFHLPAFGLPDIAPQSVE